MAGPQRAVPLAGRLILTASAGRSTGIALGDQALFCTRALFEARGGFPPLPILEDYEFTRGLRAAGVRLCLVRLAVETSGRRWEQRGFWRTWWQYRQIYWRHAHGADPAAQARGYEQVQRFSWEASVRRLMEIYEEAGR